MKERQFIVTILLVLATAIYAGNLGDNSIVGGFHEDVASHLSTSEDPITSGEDKVCEECIDCFWRETPKGGSDGEYDNCVIPGKGKTCGFDEGTDPPTPLCCDGATEEECDCNTPNVNPCDNPEDCLACMAYAEERGEPLDCAKAAICAALERIDNPDFGGGNLENACDVVSDGEGGQFSIYQCVCDSAYSNQGYCECCSNPKDIKGKDGKRLKKIKDFAASPDCGKDFPADSFNAPGAATQWTMDNCVPVGPGTPGFNFNGCKRSDTEFWECSG